MPRDSPGKMDRDLRDQNKFHHACYWEDGKPPMRKPKLKHNLKVHVWAGISRHGATKICAFQGIMKAYLYCSILKDSLLLIREKLPDHRFMQDNDPEYTSQTAKSLHRKNVVKNVTEGFIVKQQRFQNSDFFNLLN